MFQHFKEIICLFLQETGKEVYYENDNSHFHFEKEKHIYRYINVPVSVDKCCVVIMPTYSVIMGGEGGKAQVRKEKHSCFGIHICLSI